MNALLAILLFAEVQEPTPYAICTMQYENLQAIYERCSTNLNVCNVGYANTLITLMTLERKYKRLKRQLRRRYVRS